VRDFTAVIKNKVRQGKGKIGYLPVDQILEGPPLECVDKTPQNVATDGMHQRMQLIASRLEKRQMEAAEQFPSAIIFPSADGKLGATRTIGALPAPMMIGGAGGTPTDGENGSSGNLMDTNEATTTTMAPAIQIYHDRQRSQIAAVMAAAHQEVKSPSQLVSQVDQVSKEELGQLIQKLQYENM
jgi:hypothetical protein